MISFSFLHFDFLVIGRGFLFCYGSFRLCNKDLPGSYQSNRFCSLYDRFIFHIDLVVGHFDQGKKTGLFFFVLFRTPFWCDYLTLAYNESLSGQLWSRKRFHLNPKLTVCNVISFFPYFRKLSIFFVSGGWQFFIRLICIEAFMNDIGFLI